MRVEEGEEPHQAADLRQLADARQDSQRGHRQGERQHGEGRLAGEVGEVLDRVGRELVPRTPAQTSQAKGSRPATQMPVFRARRGDERGGRASAPSRLTTRDHG